MKNQLNTIDKKNLGGKPYTICWDNFFIYIIKIKIKIKIKNDI